MAAGKTEGGVRTLYAEFVSTQEVGVGGITGAVALSFAATRFLAWALAGNTTINAGIVFPDGAGYYTLRVVQSGAFSLTWPAEIDFGAQSTDITAPGTYIFSIYFNGATGYGQMSPKFS